VLAPVRELLPTSIRETGPLFGDRFEQRTVHDIVKPTDVNSLPDFVSVSESLLSEQTGQPVEDWAKAVGIEEVGCAKIALKLRIGDQNWCVYRRTAQ